jgi:hypothetical protein
MSALVYNLKAKIKPGRSFISVGFLLCLSKRCISKIFSFLPLYPLNGICNLVQLYVVFTFKQIIKELATHGCESSNLQIFKSSNLQILKFSNHHITTSLLFNDKISSCFWCTSEFNFLCLP